MLTLNETLTVYSKPSCVQCNATTKYLDSKGVDYAYLDVTKDPEALEMIKGLGYMQAPVVVAGDEHWSGFQPDMLGEVVARLR